MNTNTVIVHGPREQFEDYAERLMLAFGCREVLLGWNAEQPITPGALHLTTEKPIFGASPLVAIYSFTDALTYAEGHGFHA